MSKTPKHRGWRVGNTDPRRRGLWVWRRNMGKPASKGCALVMLAGLTLVGLVGATGILGGLWWLAK